MNTGTEALWGSDLMGSKSPPSNRTCSVDPRNDGGPDHCPTPDSAPVNVRVRLIAEALEIPPAVLYDAPNAVSPRPQADRHETDDLARECVALTDAYKRIRDPDERHRLLALLEASADRA